MTDPQINDVRPDEAMEILRQDPNAILLDVRSIMEYDYVGHPLGALHVALMEPPDWKADPDFVTKVLEALSGRSRHPVEDTPILTLCRSGKRSLAAAQELGRHGFTRLYNVVDGFEGDRDARRHRSTVNGWRFRGLPWEQS